MKLKIALVSALLVFPSLSFAQDCSGGYKEQAMSCADGTSYDSATKSCLPVST